MTRINDPLTLPCGQVVKNRVCKAAMTERIALGNNFTNEKHIELYKMWGAGEIGILLTGNVQVHRDNLEGPANIAIEEDTYKEQMPMLKKWAEAATQELSLIHISEPTRPLYISYAVFCLKKNIIDIFLIFFLSHLNQ